MSTLFKKIFHKEISPEVYAFQVKCTKGTYLALGYGFDMSEAMDIATERHETWEGHGTCEPKFTTSDKGYTSSDSISIEDLVEIYQEGIQKMNLLKK